MSPQTSDILHPQEPRKKSVLERLEDSKFTKASPPEVRFGIISQSHFILGEEGPRKDRKETINRFHEKVGAELYLKHLLLI